MRTAEQKARSRENARRWRERNPEGAREAARRWRQRNPEKVAKANRQPRKRIYDPEKTRAWRAGRLIQPGYRERVNRLANNRATAIRRWLDDVKIRRGCIDCNYCAHAIALDFDHVAGGKTLNVCNAKSIAQAEREIAKCEVHCANCHRVRTHLRRQARKSHEKSSL